MIERSAWNTRASEARVKRPANYTFLWRCNDDPIKQVTILSTVPKCKWKSWISDSVQHLVVVQMRSADVKPLWEYEREKTRSSWITLVFSDDWFNLLVCVDLFTHLTYILYSINVCWNFPHYKLKVKLCNIHTIPHKILDRINYNYYIIIFFPRPGNCGFKMSLLFHVLTLIKATDACC